MINKRSAAFFSVLIILIFIGYMIYDSVRKPDSTDEAVISEEVLQIEDAWKIVQEYKVTEGTLRAVEVSPGNNIYLGGDSFVSCYNKELEIIWKLQIPSPITSLSFYGDTLFASTLEQVLLINNNGELISEWGPYESNSLITSISANRYSVAFADAGNKTIFILDKGGEVKKMAGHNDGQFIIPSPYFDVELNSDNTIYVANTGQRRIEHRDQEGKILTIFGEPGTAPGAFCGCCNPAHFVVIPDGFITAEKGINRIKILNRSGEFVEYVSSNNKFMASIPLDLASNDGITIYAANSYNSKLYIYKRK